MNPRLITGLVAAGCMLAAASTTSAAESPPVENQAGQDAAGGRARTALSPAARLEAQRREEATWAPTPPGADPRDFTGLWESRGAVVTLVQADGSPPPFTPAEAADTQRHIDSAAAGNVITDAPTQCFPHGVPRLITAPYPIRFAHAPGMVVLLHEVAHNVRIVYLDRPAPPPNTPLSFLGYSVGHWDGNTLVVETTHLNDQTMIDGRTSHGTRLKVTERLTKYKNPFGGTDLEDLITIDDPDHFTKPWTARRSFAFRGDLASTLGTDGLVEYSCEENNRNIPDATGIVTAK